MSRYNGARWTAYIIFYFLIYFLIIYSYINMRASVGMPKDACALSPNDRYRLDSYDTNMPTDVVSYPHGIIEMLKFAGGFHISNPCLIEFGWLYVFIFTYVPAFMLLLAVIMLYLGF